MATSNLAPSSSRQSSPNLAPKGSAPSKGMLSTSALARQFGLSTKTIHRMKQSGRIAPSFKTCGNHNRWDANQVSLALGIERDAQLSDKKPAGIVRVSTQKQANAGSLERQANRVMAHICEVHQCEPKDVLLYREVNSSFTSRKVLNRLVKDIIAGKISHLYCEHMDRLSRVGALTRLIEFFCEEAGTEIICLDKSINKENASFDVAELIAFLGAISAKSCGKRGGLEVFRSVSSDCEIVVREYVLAGCDVQQILRHVQEAGFTSTNKRGIENKISRRILQRLVSQILMITDDDELEQSNTLNQFIEDKIKTKDGNTLSGAKIWEAYQNWCGSKCKIAISIGRVGRQLAVRFKKNKKLISGLSNYVGLSIKVG